MQGLADKIERRTSTDAVFEQLHREIASLELLPGTKLSEAEVAKRFSVSRQPVRDAFVRLASMELLVVRPQKATLVRGFSLERIAHTRFVRLAVELEVLNQACKVWNSAKSNALQNTLDEQQDAVRQKQLEKFHTLDNQFHQQICELSDCHSAIEVITDSRQKLDRLCALSLSREKEAATLIEDHMQLARALEHKSIVDATCIAAGGRRFGAAVRAFAVEEFFQLRNCVDQTIVHDL